MPDPASPHCPPSSPPPSGQWENEGGQGLRPTTPPAPLPAPPLIPLAVGQKRERVAGHVGTRIDILAHDKGRIPNSWKVRYLDDATHKLITGWAPEDFLVRAYPILVPPLERPEDIPERAWSVMSEDMRERVTWALDGKLRVIGTLGNMRTIQELEMQRRLTLINANPMLAANETAIAAINQDMDGVYDRDRDMLLAELRVYTQEYDDIMSRTLLEISERQREQDLNGFKSQRIADMLDADRKATEVAGRQRIDRWLAYVAIGIAMLAAMGTIAQAYYAREALHAAPIGNDAGAK